MENLDFIDALPHSWRNRPKMIVSKLDFGTLLIFANLKFRLMGATCRNVREKMEGIEIPVKTFKLLTMTVTDNIGKSVNLNKLPNVLRKRGFTTISERELFPSLLIKTKMGVIHLFASGKCVFLGVTNILSCYEILNLLKL